MYRSRCIVFYRDEYDRGGKVGCNLSYLEVFEGRVPPDGLQPVGFWSPQRLGLLEMFPKAFAVYDVAFRQQQFGRNTQLTPVSAEYVEDFDVSRYLSGGEVLRVAK